MKKLRFKKIDAFASGSSAGNPAAAVYLESFEHLSEPEMQRIARELKGFVCEVGYISETGSNAYKLKYYSSEKEVEFCGHATIAIMYDILKHKDASKGRVSISTNKGVLDVENRIASEDSVFITSPEPKFSVCTLLKDDICSALNISSDFIDDKMPTGIVNAGNETLCLPIRSLDSLVSITPDYDTLKSFCNENKLDVVTIFTNEVSSNTRAYRTRVFAAPFGYLEDPATGSGNAALGYHLAKQGMWRGDPIVLEQNNNVRNPNIIKMEMKLDSNGLQRVIFGGSAITRIDGYYLI